MTSAAATERFAHLRAVHPFNLTLFDQLAPPRGVASADIPVLAEAAAAVAADFARGDEEGAKIRAWAAARSLTPQTPEATTLSLLGAAAQRERRHAAAATFYTLAIARSPDWWGEHHNRAIARIPTAPDLALQDFRAALALAPDAAQSWAALAFLLALDRRWAACLTAAKAAIAGGGSVGPPHLIRYCLLAATEELGLPPALPFALPFVLGRGDPGDLRGRAPAAPDWPGMASSFVVFVHCDPVYLRRYGLTLAWSLAAAGFDGGLLFLLAEADPADFDLIDRLQATIPMVEVACARDPLARPAGIAPHIWYPNIRFLRLAQLARQAPATTIMLSDADVLFRRDPRTMSALAVRPPADVGVLNWRTAPPWEQCGGAMLLMAPTAAAREVIDRIGFGLAAALDAGESAYGMDQVALYLARHHLTDRARFADVATTECCDTDFGPAALSWAVILEKDGESPYNALARALAARFGPV